MNTQAENGSLSSASPQSGDAAEFVKRGFQLVAEQRLDDAVASLDRAVALEPDFAEAWIGRGIALFYLGRLDEAVASYDRVLALGPDADAFSSRALALYALDRLEEAVAGYDQALALKPDAQAFNIRGMALHKLGRLEAAVESYDQALALKPDYAEVLNSRSATLAKLGRYDQALASIDQAIALRGGSAEICLIVGVELYNGGRFDGALACYDRALALKPDYADAHFHRALVLLAAGDFARGFEDYRWRFRIEDERRRPSRPAGIGCPDWEGEPLAGKRLVIFVEQGYGDALQFVRYVPMAVARGAQVTLFAPAALLTLLRASLPGVEVTDTLPNAAGFDYQAPMLCLPRLFGTTLDTIPAQVPYLRGDQTAAASWAQRLAALPGLARPGLKVGLVWAGSSRLPDIDARRSLKLAQLAPLAAIPGIRFISLQIGEPAEEAKTPPAGLALIDWTDEIRDYADTAALVAGLDLVITVDTSVAHLAGGLGKPVWILSRYDGCWRWLTGREDSPWYPTARLFHQPTLGDWDSVIGQVATALQAFAAQAGSSPAAVDPHAIGDAVALVRQGLQLAEQQRFDQALANFEQANAIAPDFAEAWISRGIVLDHVGRLDDAVASYDRALALEPDADIFGRRGAALYRLGRFEEAAASYDSALSLRPDAATFNSRGAALYNLGRFDQALACYDRALALKPDCAEVLLSRGATLVKLARFDQALESIDRARALGSGSAEIYQGIGLGFHHLGRLDDALACYDRALALEPDRADTRYNRAVTLLRAGDLAHGFEEYRWRFRIPGARPARPDWLACPDWEGEPISGKRLVIFVEQGYGDTLQFVRYAPMAQALGAHVTLFVPPALTRLLRASLPGLEVVDRLPETTVFDYQAPMLCLPRLFGTTLNTVPADTPYLLADPSAAAAWARRLAALPGLKVGLVWAGGREQSYDARRSLKLDQFAPLAAVAGVQFVSLQLGEPAEQARTPPAGLQLVDWTNEIRDYADTAALVSNLDLVITVDTSAAHLAGALNKPVWILSRHDGCWRWPLGRNDSPWYPTARLFHQSATGQWEPVVAEVAAALQAFASQWALAAATPAADDLPAAIPPRSDDDAVEFARYGLQLNYRKRFDEAVANFDKAVALDPDFTEAWISRGIALFALGRFGQAAASYGRALALRPDAEIFSIRGLAWYMMGRLDDAITSYDQALALQPDYAEAQLNRAQALLRAGDLARGFEAYHWRFRIEDRPARPDWLACRDWQGEPIAGKQLVIFHEQGFGDSLQFVRYVPLAVARGAHVTLFVPPVLSRLLRASLPGVEVVDSLHRNSVFDFQAPMLDLPRIFGTTLDTIPAEIPYLAVDQAAAAAWTRRLAALPGAMRPDLTRPDLKIGLVWAGGKDRAYDEYRSLTLAQFAPLATVPGVRFINLQLGESAEEAKTPPAGLELIDWTGEIADYADTAALVAGLDLVITVCTSVAHLAGALGKPVWILLHEGCCWRWLMSRQDSPWYPSARLFRQPAVGQWDPVIADVAAALKALAPQPEALEPDCVQACRDKGLALYRRGSLDDALVYYDRALALEPDADTFNARGAALYELGRCDEAIASYDRALALRPDRAETHWNRARALLRAGDLARGFDAYRQCIERYGDLRAFACPLWKGEPLAGKRLLIFSEYGHGDTMQFVRYVPMAQALGARIVLLVEPAMLRLLRASLPGVEVVDSLLSDTLFDFQVAMLCLPALFGTALDTIPAPIPYLRVDPAAAADWAPRLSALTGPARPDLKIGLVWAGARDRSYDARRSLDLSQLAPLAAVAGVQFVSLQLGEAAEQAGTPPAGLQLVDLTSEIRDYADTAALVDGLDLVITVDTSVAHLAGALGKPVWILSRFDGCWRWLLNRQDSPWYPTARLFHQSAAGGWEPVVADVAAALQAFASHAETPGSTSDDAVARVNRGVQLAYAQRFDEALASFDGAIALRPDLVEARLNRGIALFYLGRFDEAVASYDGALALRPDWAEALNLRAAALARRERFDEALESADRAIALGSGSAEVCLEIGLALYRLGRLDRALACCDRALALRPDWAEALNSRSVILDTLGRCDEALACYDRVLALEPDRVQAQWNRTRVLLRTGDLARGFDAYRQCMRRYGEPSALACPEWQGEPLAGKRLVIFSEHGYGDTLQFVRYAPMAAALGAHITVLVRPELKPLLRASLPGIEVTDSLPGGAVFDFQVAMLCLPSLFHTTLDAIPAPVPYLQADPAAAASWARRLANLPGLTRPGLARPKLKVGLVWAGNRERSNDAHRSLKLAQFAALASVPDVQFVSLQLGEPAEEARTPPAGLQLIDWTNELGDYADTAALVAGLDLVISVCTSVAHLAGAMGKPVWIPLHYDSCWRWLLDREDSPWYPTARLFRQPAMGAWEPAMAHLAAALRTLASKNVLE